MNGNGDNWKTAFPKPDWEHEDVLLYCGDCLDILPQLPAGCVDAVVTDPPYGVGKASWDDGGRDEFVKMVPRWYHAIERWPSYVTPGIVNLGIWPPARWVLAWLKTNAMGASRLSGYKAVSRTLWEPVLFYGKTPVNPPARDLIYEPLNPASETIEHPCPKPCGLMRQIIGIASNVGGVICDPLFGSGTTGVACAQTNRRFVGIEIDAGYFDIAVRRIKAAIRDDAGKFAFAQAKAPDPQMELIQ